MTIELCLATRVERHRSLPGDELVPRPMWAVTHAITIDVPPEGVWPWLVQMGSGRAGWYAYDRIDNGGTPSANQMIPELQHLVVGDIMPWLPGAKDGFVVGEAIPERALVLLVPLQPVAPSSEVAERPPPRSLRATWALVLEPADHSTTRLIARGRVSRDYLALQETNVPGKPIFIERIYSLLAKLPLPLLFPIAGGGHYVMESRMLRGIKLRAERHWARRRLDAEG